jgi:hypothetical protein
MVLGLDQDTILGLIDHAAWESFSELEKLALDYAVALSDTPAENSDELRGSAGASFREAAARADRDGGVVFFSRSALLQQ